MDAMLALEDGRIFTCRCFTEPGEAWGEVVFNTSMTGYQEVLTDPSYRGQMVTMTYPLIGNYGVNDEDVESDRIQAAAFIVREYQPCPSNFRATGTLADYLNRQHIIGVDNLDTRALTRHLRTAGAMRGFISCSDLDPESLVKRVKMTPVMVGRDLVGEVTTEKPYRWEKGRPERLSEAAEELTPDVWRHRGDRKAVVVFDYGVKYNILRCLEQVGCEVLVVPAKTGADTVKRLAPDGVFLSNGPGDPEPLTYAVDTIRQLLGVFPIFGICLGNQLLGLAMGGKTYKLKFGHRGANQPAKNFSTGRVEITSQNHGFAVDTGSIDMGDVNVTHINLNDNTLEGFRHQGLGAFSVQYHPEASPGPHDARYLFDDFVKLMKAHHA
ncbi:MAG: glutamine-hydrolyzing carbamoyl-phosphate synthase small subunit [Thermodesulfobacteriota bacterium]